MAKVKFEGELAKKILLGVAVTGAAGALAVTLAVMPGLGRVIKELLDWYEQEDARGRYRIRKTFQALRKERLISRKNLPDGTVQFVLSEKGKKKVLKYRFDDLKIQNRQKWDGRWHFLVFDIPNAYKRERELWRRKLRTLGFYPLQRSVWVHAFPCRDEIDFVSEYIRVSPFVRIVEATAFDGDEELKRFFFS